MEEGGEDHKMAPTLALRQFCGLPELVGIGSSWKASMEHRAPWNWSRIDLEALWRQPR